MKVEKQEIDISSATEKPPIFIRKIGNTVYKVEIHFSKTSNEDVYDKLKRLILNDY